MGDTTLFTIYPSNKRIPCVIVIAALLGGCGTFAPLDPSAPASHHAQRRYDELVSKGAVVPPVKAKENRK